MVMFSKSTIRKKTAEMGVLTLISRFFGITREVLMVRYLGPTAISDIFLTAFKIPNSLRKIFAEGALSAALVPSLVQALKQGGKKQVSGLLMASLLFFEFLVLLLCFAIIIWSEPVLQFIVPGFSQQAVQEGIPFLRVLMPFIFFLSSGAVIGAALHATGHFFIPAFAPILLNIIFIFGLSVCIWFDLPVIWLCWFIFFSGITHLLLHIAGYIKEGFSFTKIKKEDFSQFWAISAKFLLCLPTISLMELNLFIDTSFASYLPAGSISLIHYANRFAGIPMGIFAVALSTILLPHFSRVALAAPKRLPFYLVESLKLIFWLMIPTSVLMGFFSQDLFYTVFLSKKFTLEHVQIAGQVLAIFSWGLFSFSANKILACLFYAIHVTWVPALISLVAITLNMLFNWFFLSWFGIFGLAFATTLSAIIQTIILLFVLHKSYKVHVHAIHFLRFIIRYGAQILMVGGIFYGIYCGIIAFITHLLPQSLEYVLLKTIGLWVWVGPLAAIMFGSLWITRTWFGVHVYFLN